MWPDASNDYMIVRKRGETGMLLFLMGFWCGGVVMTIVLCGVQIHYKKSRKEKTALKKEPIKNEKTEGYGVTLSTRDTKILLADDSKLSRSVIKEILGQTGIAFGEAEDGTECIRIAENDRYDMIFLDQLMPGMNGTETLQKLRRIEGCKHIPVIAVSSFVNKENEKEFLGKGFSDCLAKPIQSNRLEELLVKWLPPGKLIQKPDGYSYQNGLKNFDGNTEAYEETLLLFAQLWEERKEQLATFLEEENMEEYAILIHAIKGDARTLGADLFGKQAYEQELAAKAGDVASIKESYRRVILTGDKTAAYFKCICSK